MKSRMNQLCWILSLVIVALATLPAATLTAAVFDEDFSTTDFAASVANSVEWATADGEIRLRPYFMDWDYILSLPTVPQDVAVAGNYAYIAVYTSGLSVVDVSNPLLPVLVGSYNTPGFTTGIAVDGNVAYLADGSAGLQVIDISDPTTPVLIGNVDPYGTAKDVVVDGDIAYLASDFGGIHAINIQDPTAPYVIGTVTNTSSSRRLFVDGEFLYSMSYNHDFRIFDVGDPAAMSQIGYRNTPGNGYDLFVEGNTAYVAAGSGGLIILDVTEPTLPVQIGTTSTGGNTRGVNVVGGFAYVADYNDGVVLLDARNPAAIETITVGVGSASGMAINVTGERVFLSSATGGLYGFAAETTLPLLPVGTPVAPMDFDASTVVGNVAFVAAGANGMFIFNIDDPENPVEIGHFNDPGYVWDCNAVAVAGDYAFIADGNRGLVAVDISDLSNPVRILDHGISFNDVVIEGDIAYAVGGTSLYAIDISDPTFSLGTAGSYTLPATASNITVKGNLAYIPVTTSGIQVMRLFATPGVAFTPVSLFPTSWAFDIAVDGDRAYVADGAYGLKVLDVSNPAALTQIGSYLAGTVPVRVLTRGNHLYVSESNNGIKRYDITNPASPVLIDAYDNSFTATGMSLAGDYILMSSAEGFGAVGAYQRIVDLNNPSYGLSTIFATPVAEAVMVRLTTVQTPEVTWEISADDGLNWTAVAAGGAWQGLSVPGHELRWRSTHTNIYPRTNPTCSDLQIEWRDGLPVVDAIVDVPGDQGRQVSLSWLRSGYDFLGSSQPILEYAVYRRIDDTTAKVIGTADQDKAYPPGNWHFVTTVPADAEEQYAVVVPTLGDSTVTDGLYESVFFVRARTAVPGTYFDAAPDSGYSVDNLAPSIPTGFKMAGVDLLAWDELGDADFRNFTVYGSASPVLDETATLIDYTIDTTLSVSGPAPDYYLLTATDFAGNESQAVVMDMASEVPGTVAPLRTRLLPNHPNPFNPATVIAFDLAVEVPVRLTVYDVSGRSVRTLLNNQMMATGRHQEHWDGRNEAGQPAAAGVYLYRIEAGTFTETRRMTLVK